MIRAPEIDPKILEALDMETLEKSRNEWRALAVRLYSEKESRVAKAIEQCNTLVSAWAEVAADEHDKGTRAIAAKKASAFLAKSSAKAGFIGPPSKVKIAKELLAVKSGSKKISRKVIA